MATVQDKRDAQQEQVAAAETHPVAGEKREKFVRFDDPHMTSDHHDHEDDGDPPLSEKIIMVNVVILPLIAMLSVIAMSWSYGFMGWLYIGLLFGGWYVTGLGITVGFHRLFSHHSFQCTRSVKIFWAVIGALAVEGSPIKWCAVHRKHHQFSDHHGDPHSPHLHEGGAFNIVKGFLHSHLGWLIYGKWTQKETQKYAPDLLKDPVLMWLHNNYVWVVTASLLIPAVIAGLVTMSFSGFWLGFLWGGLARVCFTHHMTWSINSICHIFGSQDYKSSDDSKNNFLFGILSHGEGWHNNHHAFPTSARHGLKWWQFDLSWVIIRGMQACGLVWKVRLPSEKALEKRALN